MIQKFKIETRIKNYHIRRLSEVDRIEEETKRVYLEGCSKLFSIGITSFSATIFVCDTTIDFKEDSKFFEFSDYMRLVEEDVSVIQIHFVHDPQNQPAR